ncbi:monofunctional biosynthetic peptidoglycan transglycosylase [Thermithiobacillus plumbiphilus]|uniref:Biosynthetic peptidoglycan transglycosylase n=1 Tax=Thermithiobacillus plumbiphilus TaxID=1729899 RepID=A0ABU9D5F2_9PROT
MQTLLRWTSRLIALALAAILLYQGWLYLQVRSLAEQAPASTALMAARLAAMEAEGRKPAIKQKWVPINKISKHLQRAVIVSEDATFYGHEGFDWEGIKVAARKNLRKGRIVAGGSTISQQLAKNLYLSTKRTPWRKGQEAVITLMLEKNLEKRRIFEIYLNVIEWGDGVFGAEAAARHYFGVSAAKLTPRQAAKLAAMIPNPRYYDKHRKDRRLLRKSRIILARMGQRYGPDFNAPPRLIQPRPKAPVIIEASHPAPDTPETVESRPVENPETGAPAVETIELQDLQETSPSIQVLEDSPVQ